MKFFCWSDWELHFCGIRSLSMLERVFRNTWSRHLISVHFGLWILTPILFCRNYLWHGVRTTVLRQNPHQHFCGFQVLPGFSSILQFQATVWARKSSRSEMHCWNMEMANSGFYTAWAALREISRLLFNNHSFDNHFFTM